MFIETSNDKAKDSNEVVSCGDGISIMMSSLREMHQNGNIYAGCSYNNATQKGAEDTKVFYQTNTRVYGNAVGEKSQRTMLGS